MIEVEERMNCLRVTIFAPCFSASNFAKQPVKDWPHCKWSYLHTPTVSKKRATNAPDKDFGYKYFKSLIVLLKIENNGGVEGSTHHKIRHL
jgi:hypothetical protein